MKYCLATLALLFSLVSSAQFNKTVELGVFAGAIFSQGESGVICPHNYIVWDENNVFRPSTAGAGGGFLANIRITDALGAETGLSYRQRIYVQNDDLTTLGLNTAQQKITLHGLEVPVGLKFRSPEIGNGIHIGIGLGLAFQYNLTRTHDRYEILTNAGSGGVTYSLNENFSDNDGNWIKQFNMAAYPKVEFVMHRDWGSVFLSPSYRSDLLGIGAFDGTNDTKLHYVALDIGYLF